MFKDIINFKNSKEWIEFKNYYDDKSFTEQLGLFRYEDANTNFLASLLKSDNIYGYTTYPMKLLLELIKIKSSKDYFKDVNLLNNYDINNLSIKTREALQSGIPDLHIRFNINEKEYLILIEAKLQSDEQEKQTQRYYDDLKNVNVEKIFIYLTLDGGKCSCKEYELITYQELIDYVYTPLTFIKSNDVALTVEEYLKSFNALYYQEIFDNNDIIPMNYKSKELTLKLWEQHQKLFKKIFIDKIDNKSFLDFYNSHKEVFRILFINIDKLNNDKLIEVNEYNRELLEYISKIASKVKCINMIDNNSYNNSEFIYRVFHKIVNENNITYEELKSINNNGKYQYIYSKEDFVNLKHYRQCYDMDCYGELIINNEKYYYCIRSNEKEIKNLIKKIESDSNLNKYKNGTFKRIEDIFN